MLTRIFMHMIFYIAYYTLPIGIFLYIEHQFPDFFRFGDLEVIKCHYSTFLINIIHLFAKLPKSTDKNFSIYNFLYILLHSHYMYLSILLYFKLFPFLDSEIWKS